MHEGENWTSLELEAAVDAYLSILEAEQQGQVINKSAINAELRQGALSGRSKGAVEFRMQNISSALNELCVPWVFGYKPAKNVGNKVKDQILSILKRKGLLEAELAEPTENGDDLLTRTKQLRKRLGKGIAQGSPRGQLLPKQTIVQNKQFIRDPLVRAWVLEVAAGVCEACGNSAPFQDLDGLPFLEVHHVTPLANGGSDVVQNAVAICPNCHRRLHYSIDKDSYAEALRQKVARLNAK